MGIREFEKDPGMEGEATELAPASRVEIPVAGFAASDRTGDGLLALADRRSVRLLKSERGTPHQEMKRVRIFYALWQEYRQRTARAGGNGGAKKLQLIS